MDSKCLIPLWLRRAPQAFLDLPSPKQLGGGGAATEGLTGQEQWRQDSRVLPHGRHMSLTSQSRAPSPWVVGLPLPPDAFLQALLERTQTGEGREERKGYWLNKVRENHNQYPLNEIHMHISILKTL